MTTIQVKFLTFVAEQMRSGGDGAVLAVAAVLRLARERVFTQEAVLAFLSSGSKEGDTVVDTSVKPTITPVASLVPSVPAQAVPAPTPAVPSSAPKVQPVAKSAPPEVTLVPGKPVRRNAAPRVLNNTMALQLAKVVPDISSIHDGSYRKMLELMGNKPVEFSSLRTGMGNALQSQLMTEDDWSKLVELMKTNLFFNNGKTADVFLARCPSSSLEKLVYGKGTNIGTLVAYIDKVISDPDQVGVLSKMPYEILFIINLCGDIRIADNPNVNKVWVAANEVALKMVVLTSEERGHFIGEDHPLYSRFKEVTDSYRKKKKEMMEAEASVANSAGQDQVASKTHVEEPVTVSVHVSPPVLLDKDGGVPKPEVGDIEAIFLASAEADEVEGEKE